LFCSICRFESCSMISDVSMCNLENDDIKFLNFKKKQCWKSAFFTRSTTTGVVETLIGIYLDDETKVELVFNIFFLFYS
jgi:hypothetical protein